MTREAKIELFKDAILDGLALKYEEELKNCTEDATCTRSHYRKMSKILNVNVSGSEMPVSSPKIPVRISKKTLAAILVAAVLLLTACTTYVFKNEIAGWIEENYGSGVELSSPEKPLGDGSIQEIYALGYVPDGYELTYESQTPLFVKYIYSSDDGKTIIFNQRPLETNKLNIDAEHGESEKIDCNGKEVYFRNVEGKFVYVWKDEKYSLSISSTEQIDLSELEKIMDNVSVK